VSLEGAIQFYPKLERQHAEALGKLFMPSHDRDDLQQTDLDSKRWLSFALIVVIANITCMHNSYWRFSHTQVS